MKEAKKLKKSIENYFGKNIKGFETYQYYKGNEKLRAWICIPIAMGILDRKDDTIKAMYSNYLWNNGLRTIENYDLIWDRATLYGLRARFIADYTEATLEKLKEYTDMQLLGSHMPYPTEAFPEGNRMQLSGESALYMRIFTEGLFGIRVAADELNKKLGLQDFWKYTGFRTGAGSGYINVANGNLVYSTTDSVYPSVLLAMVMRRTYNSQSTTATSLGYGWDFSYNTCLMETESGDVILKDGDGSLHYFTNTGSGTYSAPNGIFMTLMYDSNTEEYRIIRKDNISYTFNSSLQLTKMSEFDRHSIHFAYDDSGRLETVTDGAGAQIVFAYNIDGLIETMTDPAGKTYKYEYTNGKLTKASLMDGQTEYYSESYDYTNGDLVLTDDYGNATTVDLDGNGKVVKVTPAISSEEFSFAYGNDGTYDTTTLTDRNGNSTVYTMRNDGSGCVKTITNALGHATNYTYNPDYQVTGFSYNNTIGGSSVLINYSINYDDGEAGEGNTANLLSITDPYGNVSSFTYNKYNQVLSSITPIDGSRYAETYYDYADGETGEEDNGNLLEVKTYTDKNNNEKTYTYYDYYDDTEHSGVLEGLTKSVTSSLGSKTEYYYYTDTATGHGIGWLSEVKQGESVGTMTTMSKVIKYDEAGNPIETEDALGYRSKVEYDQLGRPTTTYLPDDNIHDTVWTDNKTTSISYDLDNNRIITTDVTGISTTVVYDDMYRATQTTQANGLLSAQNTIQYAEYEIRTDVTCTKIVYTDAMNRVSTEYYDELGRLYKASSGTGTSEIITATYTYDAVGNMISVTDAEGREVKASYDKLNRQKTTTLVRANDTDITTNTVYFDNGQVDYVEDAEGNKTYYTYDDIGRIKSVTQNDGTNNLVTSYDYDSTATIDGDSYIMNTITDAKGNIKETYLDAYGRPAVEINRGETPSVSGEVDHILMVERTYNAKGQMVDITYSETKPDSTDNTVAVYEEQTDYYEYNHWGQIELVEYETQGGDNYTEYVYNSIGQLTEMNDSRDDVKGTSTPVTLQNEYEYDDFGRIEQTFMYRNKITYEYNDGGQIEKVKYYNEEDEVTQEETSYTYSSTYGWLTDIHQNGDLIRHYTYTSTGQLNYMTDYLEFNDPNSTTNNRLITDYTYTDIGQVGAIEYKEYVDGGTDIVKEKFEYEYDDRGFIEKETIAAYNRTNVGDFIEKEYDYDELGRLETSIVKQYEQGTTEPTLIDTETTSWTFDDVGNRATQTIDTTTDTYSYNEFNQLLSITDGIDTTSYTYNFRGGREQETQGPLTIDYYYDAANNLNKQESSLNNDPAYEIYYHWYNGNGQRIQQQRNIDTPTKYVYTGSALLFTTDDENDRITNNILTPSGQIIASERYSYNASLMDYESEGFYFYNFDIRQSTTSIIDNNFALKKDYFYDAYGNTSAGSQSFNNEVEFTGAVADGSGLHYMNARFYDSNSGRFLTQDTYTGNAWDPMSQNLYSYVGNNPTNFTDPTGHWAEPLLIDGEQYIRPIYKREYTKVIDIKVFFDGDDVQEEYIEDIIAGIEDWNQYNVRDSKNNAYYTLIVNIEIVDTVDEANLKVTINKNGICSESIKDDSRSHAYMYEEGKKQYYKDGDGNPIELKRHEIYIFSDQRLDSNYEGGLREIARHEFGHILGLTDAYGGFYNHNDTDAPSGSVMLESPGNITEYDLGIIFRRNPNYNPQPIQ